jgi:hypothetical protein
MSQPELFPLFDPAPAPQPEPSAQPDAPAVASEPGAHNRSVPRLKLDGPEWANVAFVIAACAGAIFSVAILFRGGALLQEVAAWPRELFSGRPVLLVEAAANNPTNRASDVAPNKAATVAVSPNESGDPFSPAKKLLGLDPASATRSRPHNDPLAMPLFGSPASSQPLNAPNRDSAAAVRNFAGRETQPGQAFSAAAATGSSAAQAAAARSTTITSTASSKVGQTTAKAAARTTRLANQSRGSVSGNGFRAGRPSMFNSAMRSIAKSLGIERRTAAQSRARSMQGRSASRTTREKAISRQTLRPNHAQSRLALTARHIQKTRANAGPRTAKTGRTTKARSMVRTNINSQESALRSRNGAVANPTLTRPAPLAPGSQSAGSMRGMSGFGVGRPIGNFGVGAMGAGLGHGGGRGR